MATAASYTPPAPYTTLSKTFDFPSQDHEFWWRTYGPALNELLSGSRYSIHQQYQHLIFFYMHIVPSLGPRPIHGHGFIRPGAMTAGQPIELSVNFQSNAKATVRYTFDPMNYMGAADGNGNDEIRLRDPFSSIAMREAMTRLLRAGQRLDQELYDHYTRALAVSDREGQPLLQKQGLPHLCVSLTQQILALDLRGEQVGVKMYSFPQAKAVVSRTPPEKLVLDSFRSWHSGNENISSAIAAIQEYFDFAPDIVDFEADSWVKSHGDSETHSPVLPQLCFSSCDLDAASRDAASRTKFYVCDSHVDLSKAESLYTLGGRLSDADTDGSISRGLDMLRDLWNLLNIPQRVWAVSEGVADLSLPPLIANYELSTAKALPVPKVYIPLHGINDGQAVESVTRFFEKIGWEEHARSYGDMLRRVYACHDLNNKTDAHAYISFTYSAKTGPYLTVYMYAVVEGCPSPVPA